MEEVWCEVKGFEGYYEVSSQGRVRGLDRWVQINGGRKFVPGVILFQEPHPRTGHLRVQLRKNGRYKRFAVHRLMLETFVGQPPTEGHVACHKNDVSSDNFLENLEWGTRSKNSRDAVRNGSNREANKTNCPRGHELIDGNLVLSQLRLGTRSCLACSRARAYLAYRGGLTSDVAMKQKSDEYYIKIKGEIVV